MSRDCKEEKNPSQQLFSVLVENIFAVYYVLGSAENGKLKIEIDPATAQELDGP